MKFLIQILAVIIICLVLQLFMPWWVAAVAGFIVGVAFSNTSFNAFVVGFIGVFLVWSAYAFWLDVQNASVLSSKIAVLFSVKQPILLVLITGLMGGITGGLGSWAGNELRKMANIKGL
jgi:hypothetical protein